jgi:hypothetical protein
MKKVLLILVAVIGFGIITNAQDVITLKNGTDIEASISVIWDTEIQYKKFDNPNGPTYTLRKSEIFRIVYQNGSIETFNKVESDDRVVKNNDNSLSGKRMFPNSDGSVSFEGTDYKIYGKDEMQNFLMNNCRPAFDQYTTGKRMQHSGGICLALGIPLSLASIGLWWLPGSIFYGPIITGGLTGMWIGGAINLSRGNRMVNGAFDTYNRMCTSSKSYSYKLEFGLTGNGMGVQLTF